MKNSCIVLAATAILAATASYAVEEPSLYPVNAVLFKLVTPDGREMPFVRSLMDANYLEGNDGWCAKVMRRDAVATTGTIGDRSSGVRYEFESGLLMSVYTNGVKSAFVHGEPSESLSSLYPNAAFVAKRVTEAKKKSDIWEGSGRLRLFWENPNKAGAALAGIFLLFISAAARRRHTRVFLRAAYGVLAALSAVALILTESRGAFLGAVAGMLALVVFRLRTVGFRLAAWKIACALAVLTIGIALAVSFHVGDRFTRGIVETGGGNAVRVDIFNKAPRMMADAPRGWGAGNSGAAYCMWYRAPEVSTMPRTLINSHLTLLVEYGNLLRFAYLAGWALLLLLLADVAWRGGGAFPVACLVSLAVSALFNHVMEDWACLALPVAATVAGLVSIRPVQWRRIAVIAFVSCAVAAGSLFAAIKVGERQAEPPRIYFDGKVTIVNGDGKTKPEIWIVGDEFVLGGWDFIGGEFEIFFRDNHSAPAMAYVEKIDDLPPSAEKLVLAGLSGAEYVERWKSGRRDGLCRANATLFLSPSMVLTDVPEDLAEATRLRGVVGSLAARRVQGYAEAKPPWVRIAPGCLLYIPGWLTLAAGF